MIDPSTWQGDSLRLFDPPESRFDGVELKPCRTCDRELPISMFGSNSMSRLGRARCTTCMRRHDQLVRSQDYEQLIRRFGDRCNACEATQCEPQRPNVRFCIDVDHQLMAVRGLLCKRCNVAIGMLRDDPTVIAKLIVYLLERS